MGLFAKILALPLVGPISGVGWIADKLAERAEDELYSEDAVRAKLMELEERYLIGQIDEERYAELEEALLARLKLIRAWRAARGR